MSRRALSLLPALVLLTLPAAALAHEAEGVAGGFVSGFLHPMLGPDHLAAMVAVGLWGAVLGRPAVWVLPVAFPLVMAAGGVLGILGAPLPAVEPGIAASALVLGVMVALWVKPPLWAAAALVAVFAVFHGHAHGEEMPAAAAPAAYGVGFVLGTGLLHLVGIGFGALAGSAAGRTAVRLGGGVIAAAGLGFLIGAV